MPVRFALLAAALAIAVPAFAHPGHASVSGFLHPLSGADHVLAMVSIGVWAALLGGRSLWLVPMSFVACLTGGFAAAVAGVGLPAVEPVIVASVLVLGALAVAAVRPPLAASMGIAGFFAVFHGYAHGGGLSFGVGLIAATVVLLLAGVGLGRMLRRRRRPQGWT